MTVENLLSLLVSNPPPPLVHKLPMDNHTLAGLTASHLQQAVATSGHMAIPTATTSRQRHQSWGSTGASSGKSSPLSGSPPIHDLISLQLHFPTTATALVSTPTKATTSRLERCLSAATTAEQQQAVNQKNVNPTRYKTEMCRPFEESGHCKYGDKCQFAHGRHELRSLSRHPKYKTDLCRTYHTVGFCPYGPRCHFIHNEDEAKLSEITHIKQQQIMQQVAQHVAQRQHVLSRMALTQQQAAHYAALQDAKAAPVAYISNITAAQIPPPPRPQALDFSSLSLGSTIDSGASSISESISPSLSPTSMLCDDVFNAGSLTPPPGFNTAVNPVPKSGVFAFQEMPSHPLFCVKANGSTATSLYSPMRSSTPVDAPRTPEPAPISAPSPSTSPVRLPIFSRLAIDN